MVTLTHHLGTRTALLAESMPDENGVKTTRPRESSFPRKRDSIAGTFWIPAFAGMTFNSPEVLLLVGRGMVLLP